MTPVEQATTFLTALGYDLGYPKGLEFRALFREGRRLVFWPGSGRGTPVWPDLVKANEEGANVYVGPAQRDGKGGSKDNVVQSWVLWADLDAKLFDADDIAHGKELALEHLRHRLPPELQPSVLIDSGNGYHCYWLLREAYTLENLEQRDKFEAQLSALAHTLRADPSVAEVARIMRVPGLLNRKNDPPVPCTLLECHPERRFTFDDFEGWLDVPPPPATESATGRGLGQSVLLSRYLRHVQFDTLGFLTSPEVGYKVDGRDGDVIYLTRPGKEDGVSASFNKVGPNWLHNFSWNDPNFAPNTNHSPEDMWVTLKFGGDVAKAEAFAREQLPADVVEQAEQVAAQAVQAQSMRFLIMPELLLGQSTEVDWLIDRLLPKSGILISAADGGTFKTWTALDLALAIATGGKWMGHFQCADGRVLIVDEESTERLIARRMLKLLQGRGVDMVETGRIGLFVQGGFTFDNAERLELLRARVVDFDPSLIIFDSTQDIFTGDENSAKDVGALFRGIRDLQRLGGAGVFMLHHTRKLNVQSQGNVPNAMLRGSTRFRGEVDSYLYSTLMENGHVKFTHNKSRHGEPVPDWEIAVEDNVDGTATTVKYLSESLSEMQKDKLGRYTILNLLDQFGKVSKPSLIEECGKVGVPERTAARALAELVKEHLVAKDEKRPRNYWLAGREGELDDLPF